ncbi:CBD9-like protein [Trametes coccinea BRFM310]|uniref:CBD9-like protein n=1 Tax=Trametes coccinea (strain BRFM310) TaxID=1353009 RepID=A0A1Y2I613_TRAC3|nr:CBD9-like protein [Trametes coccinea BRFM310]
MRSGLALAILGLCSLAVARGRDDRGDDDHGNDGDDDDGTNVSGASANSTSTPTGTATNTSSNSTSGLTGGTVCTTYLCISGVVNGSTTTYTLQSTGKADLGWMAMGFGSTMANTPMVIMWPNSDGSITLSQRMAPAEVMPTVVANPPRVATADPSASDLTGSTPKMTFTIPSGGSASQDIIWAFGTTNPDDSAVDATLVQHLDSGPTKIDLSQSLSSNSTGNQNPVTDPNASTGTVFPPLQPFQKMIIAHALLCTIGFLIVLPAGGLLARYARTFTNTWFTGHWIFQFGLAGPVIVTGVGLGIGAVSKAGAPHLNDTHKKWGVAIFVLYFAQLALGAIIHWVKPTSWTVGRRRPLQNYLHAVFGILIIGLAFYQVRSGYRSEWPATSGRPPIDNGANIVWYVWVVLVPVLYIAGLAFLPRQLRQERPHKQAPSDEFTMREREYGQPRYSD